MHYDINAMARRRQVARLAVAVPVICVFCESTVRDENGAAVTTRDRALREGDCRDPLCIATR